MRPDNPDAWKADYDRWKLASPDDYDDDDEPEDECEPDEREWHEQDRLRNQFKRWLSRTRLAAWLRRRRFDREMASNFDDEVPF